MKATNFVEPMDIAIVKATEPKMMLRIQDLQPRAKELGIPKGIGFSVSNVRRMIANGTFKIPCVYIGQVKLWDNNDFTDYIVNNLFTRKVDPNEAFYGRSLK